MKLIDKDKLHLTYKQGTYIGGGVYDGEGYYVDGNEVANAPIVEAIPIEWIEKYLEPYKEHFNKLSDKSKEISGAGWVIDVLESMLREWEKENEINR